MGETTTIPCRNRLAADLTMSKTRPLLAFCLAVLALGLGGCGSGSSGSTTGTDTAATSANAGGASPQKVAEAAKGSQNKADQKQQSGKQPASAPPKEPTHFKPPAHHDSGGGVKQFEQKGGDNSIQESGDEADAGEFAEAAATLHTFLDARAARAWEVACEQMSSAVVKELVSQLGSAEKGGSCAHVLFSLTSTVPDEALREAAVADVGALRVEGDRGFILFRGPGGQSFFMPMAREGDHWKVAAIAASPLL